MCVSVGDALAKPTYLAALSIQVAGSLQTQRRDGKIEEIVSSLIKPEYRLPLIALYFSCKFIALEAQRSAK